MSGRGRGAPFGNSSKKQLRWLDFSLCNFIELRMFYFFYLVIVVVGTYFCFL